MFDVESESDTLGVNRTDKQQVTWVGNQTTQNNDFIFITALLSVAVQQLVPKSK